MADQLRVIRQLIIDENYSEALSISDRYLNELDENHHFWTLRCTIYQALGSQVELRTALARLVQLGLETPLHYVVAIHAYYSIGDTNTAVNLAREAVAKRAVVDFEYTRSDIIMMYIYLLKITKNPISSDDAELILSIPQDSTLFLADVVLTRDQIFEL